MGEAEQKDTSKTPPKLVSRRDHRKSTFKLGRTIGAKREKLETANERVAARKKDKKKQTIRITVTLVGFLILAVILVGLCLSFVRDSKEAESVTITNENNTPQPTIEIIDENSTQAGGQLTSRMITYVGQAEQVFRSLGYTPIKAMLPSGAIREVDFYLENSPGFIKMIVDRGAGVSVEDADRLLRYLSDMSIEDFIYIDVRIDGKAYWK